MEKDKGNEELRVKNFERAIEHYKKAIELDPSNHIFYSNMSAALYSLQKYSEAFEYAKNTVEMNPSFSKAYSRAGVALYAQGKLEEALKYYEEGHKMERHAAYDVFQREINRIKYEIRRNSKSALVNDGVWVMMVTPFKEDNSIDYEMWGKLFNFKFVIFT